MAERSEGKARNEASHENISNFNFWREALKFFIPPARVNSSLNLFLDVNYKTGRFQISKIHVLR